MDSGKLTLILFAGIILFASFVLSGCTDDPASVEEQQLQLQVSDSMITAGNEVSFNVTTDGAPVDADIYVDSSRINGTTYTFNEAGNHTAIAKKEGYENSQEIKIIVSSSEGQSFVFRSMYVSDGDVYVAGYKPLASIPHRSTPLYWKNGNLHYLGGNGVVATSIYVSGGDVYIAGYASYPVNTLGVGYWKNRKFHELTTSGAAKSIYVSEGDVYVTGYKDYEAKAAYWKNGTVHKLTDGTDTPLKEANGIYLSKDDVYVSGATARFGPSTVEFYWKNGTRRERSISGEAEDMDVSDGKVYIAGYQMVGSSPVAAYWKNGNLHKLSDGKATYIKVTGGTVYVAGWSCDDSDCTVKYWKNGALAGKYQISGSPALARSFISNGNVYVVGTVGGQPYYWTNGTPHKLDETN